MEISMYGIRRNVRDFVLHIGMYLAWPIAFSCSILGFALLVIEAFFIMLFRGPRNVRWVRPSRCDSIASWMSAEWQYYGRGGMQRGLRRFGLEVARKGYISNNHPLN
ncbi:MAG TPA: hypothetical protein VGU61_16185 [Noviherbaspirillum sp.]|jgi:hypothetical protein|nr:hypothetical protein [Noviherbaspirillum sp.]